MATEIPWEKIYDFVLTCGSIHEMKDFCTEIVDKADKLCPFDQARVYFINGNGKVYDQYLVGIDKEWVTSYHEYYSKLENGRYSIPSDKEEKMYSNPIGLCSWTNLPNSEFFTDYIRPLGLSHSLGFNFYDVTGRLRTMFMLDRTSAIPFSEQELTTLNLAVPQLNNLHKNFFCKEQKLQSIQNISWDTTGLTAREIEIATLLCYGFKPNKISEKLHITQSTTYRHIANIYKKFHVSSRQELLVRLLNQ